MQRANEQLIFSFQDTPGLRPDEPGTVTDDVSATDYEHLPGAVWNGKIWVSDNDLAF